MKDFLEIFWVWLSVWGGLLFQEKYSAGWDKKLNQLMDEEVDVKSDAHTGHTVYLGDIEIWTANRWYSYAYQWNGAHRKMRPSIKTMIRFSKYIDERIYK